MLFSRKVAPKVFHAILFDNHQFYLIHAETHQRQSLGDWGLSHENPALFAETSHEKDQQLIDYLLHLRFGTSDVGQAARTVLNFASISKVVRKPVSTIRELNKRGIESMIKKLPIQRRKRSKLDQQHIDYLCNQKTLREWAHLSLIQRAVIFHCTFPEINIRPHCSSGPTRSLVSSSSSSTAARRSSTTPTSTTTTSFGRCTTPSRSPGSGT